MNRRIVRATVLTGMVAFNIAALQFFFPGTSAFAATKEKPVTVIGHRGAESTAKATENGKYAVKGALQAGANGVEVDVRETKDGKLVIMHDETVNRTTGCSGLVEELKYDALRKCTLRSGEKVPNVYDIAWTFSKYDSSSDQLWLHLKFDPSSKLRAELFKAVDKYGLRKKVVLLADEGETVDAFKKWSGIRTALIFNAADVAQGPDESWSAGYDYVVPYQTPVTKALVAEAHLAGSKVLAVESNPVSVAEVRTLGLDGIVANSTTAAVKALN